MKVLHLATDTNGGAGIAASRLHNSLLENDVESFLISRSRPTHQNQIELDSSMRRIMLGKAITVLNSAITNNEYGQVTPISIATIKNTQIERINPDVVHIHNWYNLLNLKLIKEISTKYKTVITLHDSRIYTGGCHYSLSCEMYSQSCRNCPAVKYGQSFVTKEKMDSLALFNLKSLHFIAPSQWILGQLQAGGVVDSQRTHRIPNVTPEGKLSRRIPAFSSENIVIAFIAADVYNPMKGFELFLRALEASDLNTSTTTFQIVGSLSERKFEYPGLKTRLMFRGQVTEKDISTILSETDLLVVPSIIDNSPSVIKEGQRSGCLVLATEVGGINEMVENERNGILCAPNSIDICMQLNRIAARRFSLEICKNAILDFEKHYKSDVIVQKHLEVYNAK